MKHVLVTGSTGFIGNYVVKQLLNSGCKVTATSANSTKAAAFSWFPSVNYIPFQLGLLDDAVNYYDYFGRPDLLIHLAWEGLPNYRSDFHILENLPRHKDFLSNLLRNGLSDITVTGTCFEYGMQDGCLQEDMPTYPANPYAVAKDLLRRFLADLSVSKGVTFKWVRLFYMYGKGQAPNSLLSQLEKALSNGDTVFNMSGGQQIRDYLPVEEVVTNIVKIALQHKITGVINCCSGIPVTVQEFVENYLHTNNKHISLNLGYFPYPDYESMYFWGDNGKLKSILDNE